jgi:hypothetical protein
VAATLAATADVCTAELFESWSRLSRREVARLKNAVDAAFECLVLLEHSPHRKRRRAQRRNVLQALAYWAHEEVEP